MKIVSTIFATAMLSGMLASCASSTMDSTPTLAELHAYEKVIHARHQGEYDALERQRASGAISKEEYTERKHMLDSKVAEGVNDAAWQKHFLAESERKADGVPTPDAPIRLNPGQAGGSVASYGNQGGGVTSFYRPAGQNFGSVAGIGGSAGMGNMQSVQQQFSNAKTIRNDAMSAGGTYLSQPPPGSNYEVKAR